MRNAASRLNMRPAQRPATASSDGKAAPPLGPLRDFALTAAICAPPLAISLFAVPLNIAETLQIAAIKGVAGVGMLSWIAHTPGAAPLGFFLQSPFVAAFGVNRFGARFLSLIFALAACYLFLRWARQIPLQRPALALAFFLLLPLHYSLATGARSFEPALFFLLAATLAFSRLVKSPGFLSAAWFALLLLFCLYIEPFSIFPAIGLGIGLLALIVRAHERRALCFVLPAIIAPVLLFLPYLFWARPQAATNWIFEPAGYPGGSSPWIQPFLAVAENGWAACALLFLSLGAIAAALWHTWHLRASLVNRRRTVYSSLGAILAAFVLALSFDSANGVPFRAGQALWIAPYLTVLVCAGLEAIARLLNARRVVAIGAAAFLVLSLVADISWLAGPHPDIAREAKLARSQLRPGSCVVFVSEGLSKPLFLVFQPQLAGDECLNFFHRRIVLAIHPYVSPELRGQAEAFFRGLNFIPTERFRSGGGEIVIEQQAAAARQ
jgi:4-amino-4-deoxy-L-arabinose transferase-like glycosyltransferase